MILIELIIQYMISVDTLLHVAYHNQLLYGGTIFVGFILSDSVETIDDQKIYASDPQFFEKLENYGKSKLAERSYDIR